METEKFAEWASVVHVNSLIIFFSKGQMYEYKHIKCNIRDENRINLVATQNECLQYTIKGDLLETELFNSGVWHQVEEDFERLSRLQGLFRQPEEHVLV